MFLGLTAFSILFAIATVWRPNFIFVIFLAVSAMGALFGAYRAFYFSDDWYRVREERQGRWYARHPTLTTLLGALTIGWVLWIWIDLARDILKWTL